MTPLKDLRYLISKKFVDISIKWYKFELNIQEKELEKRKLKLSSK